MSEIDIALKVLDHQILDCEGRRCGNVDDVEIEGGPGEQARVTAILVGPAGGRSGPAGSAVSPAGSAATTRVRVPWEDVEDVEAGVILRKTAADLGLGRGDDRVRSWIEKIPGAHR